MRMIPFSALLDVLARHSTWMLASTAFAMAACSAPVAREPVASSALTTVADVDNVPPLEDPLPRDDALSDGQVAAIASALQQDEIDAATIALSQADDKNVRELAQRLVEDASRSNAHLAAVVQNQNIAPIDSPLGATLRSEGQARSDLLRGESRAELDTTFLALQLKSDGRALSVLEGTLIPDVENAMLKDALVSIRNRLMAEVQRLAGPTSPSFPGPRGLPHER